MAQDSLALIAAHEVGVFRALVDGPMTAAELGERCGVSGWRLGAFLDRVAAHGFLAKEGSRYRLVPGDEVIFDPTSGRGASLGFSDVAVAFGRMARAVEVLRSDDSLSAAGAGGDATAEERARFLRYLHERSIEGAEEVAGLVVGDVGSVVDLGSGLGTYAAAVLRRFPEATAVLVDRPNAAEVVEAHLAAEGLADRARFVGGDFLTDDVGDGFDVAIVSNIVHNLGAEGSQELLLRMHPRMAPGGRILVKDLAIDAERLAPASAGRFAITMALFTPRGGVFPASEVATWLEDAGFVVEDSHDLVVAEGSYMVVGRRP